jgi:hypothetical protein
MCLPRHPAVAYLFLVRSMRSLLIFATCSLLCLTHQGLSRIGENKEELSRRYGPCQSDTSSNPKEPSSYKGVIDVGENCAFRCVTTLARNGSDELVITASFKDGKAVAFDYCLQSTFMDSLLPGQSEKYRKLWELDILRLLSMAVPNADWVKVSSDSTIRRSRTKDGKVFAYYFADGNYHRHELVVHTAAVDAVFRKSEKIIRGVRRN